MQKKKLIIPVIILVVILFMGLIIASDKTKVYKDVVNETYKVLNNTLTKYQNIPGFFNQDNNISLKLDNQKENITLNMGISPKRENIYLDLGLSSKTYNYLYTKNNSYLKKDNVYKIFDYSFKECDECEEVSLNTIISNSLGSSEISYDTLSTLLKDLKKTINKSFSKNFITKKTISTNNIKEIKYTYLLNNNSLEILVKRIENNKDLKNNIFKTFGVFLSNYDITEGNFKEVLKNITVKGTFNIYKINNKVNKIEISIQDNLNLTIDLSSNPVIYYKSDTFNMKTTLGVKSTNITLYSTNSRYLDVNLSGDNDTTNIEYNIHNGLTKSKGTVKITKDEIELKSDTLNLKATYKIDKDVSIPSTLSDYKLTEEEVSGYIDDLETSLEESEPVKDIVKYIKDLNLEDLF